MIDRVKGSIYDLEEQTKEIEKEKHSTEIELQRTKKTQEIKEKKLSAQIQEKTQENERLLKQLQDLEAKNKALEMIRWNSKEGQTGNYKRITLRQREDIEFILGDEGENNLQKIKNVVELDCGGKMYKRTKIGKSSILKAPEDSSLIMPISTEASFGKELGRKIKDRYREVEALHSAERKQGDVTFLERKIGIPIRGETKYLSRYLFLATQKKLEGDETTDEEELYNTVNNLKNVVDRLGCKRLAFPVLEKGTTQKCRNIFEYTFRNSNSEIIIYELPETNRGETEQKS